MALAIATLFFIPPDISDGYLSSESLRSTLFITSLALDIISDSDFEENILSGNIILSKTVIESNRALP